MAKTQPYPVRWVGDRLLKIHRIRAEKALGRPITPDIIVHHADGTFNADAPLVICPSQAYHFFLHIRMRVKEAGGDPNTQRICWKCHELKAFSEFYDPEAKKECRKCNNAYRAHRKWLKRRAEGKPMRARGRSIAVMEPEKP